MQTREASQLEQALDDFDPSVRRRALPRLCAQAKTAGNLITEPIAEAVRQTYVNQVPMKKGCTYDDVCSALVFLASDAASYITGVSRSVTGGQEMNLFTINQHAHQNPQ